MEKKNSKTYWLIFIGIVLIATIIVFCVWLPYKNKTQAPDSNQNLNTNLNTNQNANININVNNNINSTSNTNLNSSDNFDNKGTTSPAVQPPTTINNDSVDPYYYYDIGRTEFAKNNYQAAITYFDKAITLNPTNPNFYIKKSEAQITLHQKQAAIDTINQGLVKIPNDNLLLSQLDFIQNVVK